ncbi:MAG TPA: hypothetical protein VND23_08030 [Acidimicrobiales bacterium]|nr:hypothetical protein [Acidimicrobiales bacterium]
MATDRRDGEMPGAGMISWLRCRFDWRREDAYWRCAKRAGHRGRHALASEATPAAEPASVIRGAAAVRRAR